MGRSAFVFLFLAAVLIGLAAPLTGSLAAAETNWKCILCHSPSEHIEANADTPRFWVHAGLESVALTLSAIAALHMFCGALWGMTICGFFGFWLPRGIKKDDRIRLIDWFKRSFNLFIVAEVIASVSTSLNPTWMRIAVLMAVVIVRVLLSLVLFIDEAWEVKRSSAQGDSKP